MNAPSAAGDADGNEISATSSDANATSFARIGMFSPLETAGSKRLY
jgi:hypothetical protein